MLATLILSLALIWQGSPERYERIALPASLRTVAVEAGLESDALLVEPAFGEDGLLDRSDDAVLRLSKAALDLARNADERTALLAINLSYRVPEPRSSPLNTKARVLSALVASHIDDRIEERERRDPYLRLPATPRRWKPVRESGSQRQDQRAIRALGWARSSGVCEMRFVALLNRLARNQDQHPAISADARRVLTGLGMLRYSPDTRC